MIYQKTQPAAVFDLVMELISLEINEATAAASASAGPSRGAGVGSLPSDPLLEEVEPEKQPQQAGSTAPVSESGSGGEDSSPSSGGSFVHVETDAVVTPQGEVEVEETTAVVADLEGQGADAAEEEEEEEKDEAAPAPVAEASEDKADPPEPVLA